MGVQHAKKEQRMLDKMQVKAMYATWDTGLPTALSGYKLGISHGKTATLKFTNVNSLKITASQKCTSTCRCVMGFHCFLECVEFVIDL